MTKTVSFISTPPKLMKVQTTLDDILVLDTNGSLYSKRIKSSKFPNTPDEFQKIRFPGCEVLDIKSGTDFSVGLVRHRKKDVLSPTTPEFSEPIMPTNTQENCPLGLVVNKCKAGDVECLKETHFFIQEIIEDLVTNSISY